MKHCVYETKVELLKKSPACGHELGVGNGYTKERGRRKMKEKDKILCIFPSRDCVPTTAAVKEILEEIVSVTVVGVSVQEMMLSPTTGPALIQ